MCLKDSFGEGIMIVVMFKLFFKEVGMEKNDISFQKQRDSNLNSVGLAHGGSGFRARQFKKRIKEKQIMIK